MPLYSTDASQHHFGGLLRKWKPINPTTTSFSFGNLLHTLSTGAIVPSNLAAGQRSFSSRRDNDVADSVVDHAMGGVCLGDCDGMVAG